MFTISRGELQTILLDYEITEDIAQVEELLRYNYETSDPMLHQVRLILKVSFARRNPLVMKIKNETDVTGEMMEEQAAFADHLRGAGVLTPRNYRCHGKFVSSRDMSEYGVLITVEDYMPGEITAVNLDLAEKTGRLLARTHMIAEKDNYHVPYPVLFNPFEKNDLFSFHDFLALRHHFAGEDADCFLRICEAYQSRMRHLTGISVRKKYAVQGDISLCNLFVTDAGEVGMFDFNRCGDNILFCDAILQGIFESRLMDYDRDLTAEYSDRLLAKFLSGYYQLRPFTADEKKAIPHLYAMTTAFWLSQLSFDENSLTHLLEKGRQTEASILLAEMERQIKADRRFDFI